MKSFIVTVEDLFKMDSTKSTGQQDFNPKMTHFKIPLYQREYKWSPDRVKELIGDIKTQKKLLGIILLDENQSDKVYEIIDGQQRVTTLLFLFLMLYNLADFLEKLTIMEIIHPENRYVLKNESFGENYIVENDGKLSVEIQNDIYFQRERIQEILETIKEVLEDTDRNKLLNNLLKCQFVVIINNDTIGSFQDAAEQIFLDINEKTEALDSEDIFKGHCFKNFANHNIDTIREDWINVKKCGMRFCNTFMSKSSKSMKNFLYHYLLIRESPKVTSELTLDGKHYLFGKNATETHNLLQDICSRTNNILELYENVKKNDYIFEDLCVDAVQHRNDKELNTCRILCRELLEYKNVEYSKFPFYCLIYALKTNESLREKMHVRDFCQIINDLYIYMFLFAYDANNKKKEDIDYAVRDALKSSDYENIVRSIREATGNLRKRYVKQCTMKPNIKIFKRLAFYYSIMDFYDKNKMCQTQIYLDKPGSDSSDTLEHFIIPKKNGIQWKRNDGTFFKFKVDTEELKACKKCTINYLLLPKYMNGDIDNFDVVQKIADIKEGYRGKNLPNHISIYINSIEGMPEYQELQKLKSDNEQDTSVIESKYMEFLNAYFSDDTQSKILTELAKKIKEIFL